MLKGCYAISEQLGGYASSAVDETLRCRECREPVNLFDKFCPCCDQSDPSRLSLKGWLLLFGVPTLLTFLFILTIS